MAAASASVAPPEEEGGIELVDVVAVADEIEPLQDALKAACRRAPLVLTSGGTGLGPRDVTPGEGAGKGTGAPSDATVLFDCSSLDAWQKQDGSPAHWNLVDGGAMEVAGGGNLVTKASFGD